MSLTFRWLGAAGVRLKAGEQILAIDPFFTRPSLLGMLKPVASNKALVREKLPHCNVVLVTHSHWDHVMDVPEVLRHTGAVAYGSANTCQLLKLHGIPDTQVTQVRVGDRLSLNVFKVEVIDGQHSSIPFASTFNGKLRSGIIPPLRLQDYRMDVCLGYYITVMGMRVLICAAQPHPAELLFAVAHEPKEYYLRILRGTQPHTFVPIHWDNFLRPLQQPLQRFARPGRMNLWLLANLARRTLPGVKVIVPDLFREYTLRAGEDVRI